MKKYLTASICIVIIIVKANGQANTTLSNLTSPTAINTNLLPSNNNRNLGSAAKSWKNLYVAGNSFLKTAYTYFDDTTSQFRINNGADRLVIDDAGKNRYWHNSSRTQLRYSNHRNNNSNAGKKTLDG